MFQRAIEKKTRGHQMSEVELSEVEFGIKGTKFFLIKNIRK